MSSLIDPRHATAPDPAAPRLTLGRPAWRGDRRFWVPALLVALVGGILLTSLAYARPAYDAYGWLDWGRQLLHGHLDLNAAPSWKPLSFLFTLPYALAGHQTQFWLWTVTAGAGGVLGPLVAGRLAYRLSPGGEGWMPAWLPRALGALLAAGLTATMTVAPKSVPMDMGLLRQVLIVTADPLALALWLAAVDCHLSRRPGWTLALLWLVGLGRPEAWIFLLGYAVWVWRNHPPLRVTALLALAATPVAWFLAPALASHSWLSPGKLDLGQATAIHGNKLLGVLDRVRTLTGPVGQVEVGLAILVAILRRDRWSLGLVAGALLWAAVEVVFALRGLSAVARYMVEAGGLLAVVGGVGAARVLAWPATVRGGRLAALAGVTVLVALVALGVGLGSFLTSSATAARAVVANQHVNERDFDALTRLIHRAGGPRRILGCGTPATTLGWQSGLAWQLGLNVGEVDDHPVHAQGPSTVLFSHTRHGWRLHLVGRRASASGDCLELDGLGS